MKGVFNYVKSDFTADERICAAISKFGNVNRLLLYYELDIITGYRNPVTISIICDNNESYVICSCIAGLVNGSFFIINIVINNPYVNCIVIIIIGNDLCRCAMSYGVIINPSVRYNVIDNGSCRSDRVCTIKYVRGVFPHVVRINNCEGYLIFALIDAIFILVIYLVDFSVLCCCGLEDSTAEYCSSFRKLRNCNGTLCNFKSKGCCFYITPVLIIIWVNNSLNKI